MKENHTISEFFTIQAVDFIKNSEKYGATSIQLSGPSVDAPRELKAVVGMFPSSRDPLELNYVMGFLLAEDRVHAPGYGIRITQLEIPHSFKPKDPSDGAGNRIIFQLTAASHQFPIVAIAFYETVPTAEEIITMTFLPGYSSTDALDLIRTAAKNVTMKFN